MPDHLFRFRPIRALLDGFHELENEEIYFASPEQLNDPMEGFKDIFWRGDGIVWTNLLRHYLLCLMQAASITVISGETFTRDMCWLRGRHTQSLIRAFVMRAFDAADAPARGSPPNDSDHVMASA